MISGGPLSNVSTTGTLTIPAMKKKGYSPEFAAATESCASVGGIFMPPIMGSVVFIMSEVVGIPYASIAKRALLPAIIYFSAIFFVIDARSRKLSMEGISLEDKKPLLLLIRKGANFFIPLAYLVIRLLSGISPARVGLESILVILITSVFMKKSMLKIKIIFETLKSAINRGIMIISTMASCGILIGIINITGITAKFSSFLMSMVDLSVFLTLILVMLITLFLGLAMNITSSYLITAVICAPILIRYGFEPLSVHMFILFFSTMATITPPVALTAFTAATIAETSPMKVAFQAIKIGFVAYILPFVFVFNPAMLLSGTAFQISFSFASAFLGVYFLAMGTEGWFINSKINLVLRILLVTAGILSMFGKIYFTGIAIILVALIYLFKNHIMEGSYEKI
jgi:TRAP transporter 4TM/12TM fusion protein